MRQPAGPSALRGPGQPSDCGNRLYLTFDDGPDPRWTPRILEALSDADMRATFFVIGRLAREQGALVRQIVARGHEIGNHTWSHRHPWTMLPAAARKEVRDGAAAIADVTGQVPRLFRSPHGRWRACMTEEAGYLGQQLVPWSRSAVDWGPRGHARGIAARLAGARRGDVILMHDGGRGINRPDELAKALPSFLTDLGERGLMPSLIP